MNKRIRRKKGLLNPKLRVWPQLPDPVQSYGPVGGFTFRRTFCYSSIDLSTPVRRRAFRKGHQSAVEHRRVEAAIRRRHRRDWRRQCRGKWLEPWLRGGHMHREEDWVPKP